MTHNRGMVRTVTIATATRVRITDVAFVLTDLDVEIETHQGVEFLRRSDAQRVYREIRRRLAEGTIVESPLQACCHEISHALRILFPSDMVAEAMESASAKRLCGQFAFSVN